MANVQAFLAYGAQTVCDLCQIIIINRSVIVVIVVVDIVCQINNIFVI